MNRLTYIGLSRRRSNHINEPAVGGWNKTEVFRMYRFHNKTVTVSMNAVKQAFVLTMTEGE
jgi:hypothetical protein